MSNSYNQSGGSERDQFRQDYSAQQNQASQQKMKKRVWLIGGAIVIGLLLMMSCGTYNSLTTKREKVSTELANIDTQLQRRADLINNLVETVKGYTKHEEQVFGDIAQARSRLLNAKSVDDKAAANDQMSGALGRLLVLSENYPNLKADTQFTGLRDELSGTENRIAIARRDYNQTVNEYNTARARFPTVVMANLFGFQRAEPFKADEGSKEAPKVKF